MRRTYQKLKKQFKKYERYLLPGMLIAGLLVDFITFRSIKIETAFTLLTVYIILAGIMIFFMHIYDARDRATRYGILRYVRLISPLIVQFIFGALLSASFIFYWFSGSISTSWPLILIIAILMASNDVFRKYYLKPTVQLSVYYFILLSITSLILPYVFNTIDAWVFLIAGGISLAVIFIYLTVLSAFIHSIKNNRRAISLSVLIIYGLFNALYFFNLIPPIPLSLREAGVYHFVERIGSTYHIEGEKQTFIDRLIPGEVIHIQPGDPVYVWSTVFAPAELNTTIVHEWQFYDVAEDEWVKRDRIRYPIIGGRDGGYRGYTFKTSTQEGRWRVDVETPRGQVLGRIYLQISYDDTSVKLVEYKK